MQTIYESFLTSAEAQPDKALFRRPDQPDVSYAQIRELTQKLAAVLTGIGVQPGDRVAVQTDKSPEAICLYLATLQVGGVYLPLNTAYTGAEIDYFLGDASPRLFVCTPASLDQHKSRAGDALSVESLGASGDGSLAELARDAAPMTEAVAREKDDPAAILYTSGTTGRSKGAVLTHGNLASNTEALLQSWHYSAEDVLIHALPIFHTHGLFVAVNMTLVAGSSLIWLTKFDADQAVSLMSDATVLMGVPTFYTRLLKSDRLDRDATQNMRLFVSGSAPLLAEDHRSFEDRTGHAILERYGMTETCMITTNPYDGARKPGAVGMALPGIEIRVTDRETGKALPDGEIGAIEVRGPNVFEGYWQMPEKTASEFRDDGFFITGDLGQIGEDGYLRIVGRDKDLVISGGYNVYPKEIEALIDDLPGVLESAVIGVPHPDLGEGVTAVVVPQPGAAPSEDDIFSAIGDSLARYKQPKKIIFVEELPRNVMGKVQKAELRKSYAELYR
ncbi:malonyl-CoA/methylmalonyl-CoA synthetase [Paracoccus isoporae]|uniref:Malonyl-CoA/methylmalonyl-CoA synthetase n=1 Tax=Paracoccus isoporae TaxID=591205 RepID=A0A1G6U5P0_9RHOB|nr:malonyl-CoA synthase [Paracoccus isoporae]SDD36524.1 malonyl-CoA/methylmalonyl-CoA synthetase [Paracoccus isoporae]